jgi:hypothetical protein
LTCCGRVTAAVLLGAVALQLSGCGKTIEPETAAKSVVAYVTQQSRYYPTDVKCPSGVHAKVGEEFDCHFTGPNGVPYTAHAKVTKMVGNDVILEISTRPS